MTLSLIVTVDTEEEGLWSGGFSGSDNPVNNLQGIPNFQSICDRYGIKPTYLVNSPVVSNVAASSVLEPIIAATACEIGCHIHPWNTPPIDDNCTSERSYLCNLPVELQHEKLHTVTDQITTRFGRRPTAFRAGRYGLDGAGVRILQELNYLVDSSVCPYTDYSGDGGPDFRGAPWKPYYVGDDLCKKTNATSGILEVPVSYGFNWVNFDRAHYINELLGCRPITALHLRGILDRLRILQKIKFSPEKSNLRQLSVLAKAYAHQRAPCIVMMFHSSSLLPGFTPYVRSEKHLREFLLTIDRTFLYCVKELNMKPATLTEFALAFAIDETPTNKR